MGKARSSLWLTSWHRLWMVVGVLVFLQSAFVLHRAAPPVAQGLQAAGPGPVGEHARHQNLLAAADTGAALTFNGTNSYVRVADSASLRIPVNLTVEAWIRPTAIPTGHRHVVGKNNYALSVEPQGTGFKANLGFASGGSWRSVQSGQYAINQ